MARIETWLNQDLKQAVKVKYLDGNIFSADNFGNLIGVNVTSDGVPVTLSGSVSGSIIRADGETVAVSEGSVSGSTAYIILPQAAYAVPGTISIVLKLTSGNDITTLAAVVSNVYRTATDSAVDPGTIIPSVAELIAAIESAIGQIPADYSELQAAIYTGIQMYLPQIVWKSGYYHLSTGAYTSSAQYHCSTVKYPRSVYHFLTNWLLNSTDFVSLFDGNTYKGYFNTSNPTALESLDWDSFYLSIYNPNHPNGLDDIRFVTLGNVDTIQQNMINTDIPVIWWRQGYYNPSSGAYDGTSPRYKCTQITYKKEYLQFLKGWNYALSTSFITLFNAGTFVQTINMNAIPPETGWDTFGLTVFLTDYGNSVEGIHFGTFAAVEGIVNRAVTDAPHIINWKQGYYDPATGAYTDSTSYKCTNPYKREMLKYLQNWDFQTGQNLISLFKSDGTYVRYINSGAVTNLFADDWDVFTLNVRPASSPVSVPEITFLQMENNHVCIEVSDADELIKAVQVAIDHTGFDRYYDIYLTEGTYELWSALDHSQITGSGDQLYHRGLELPDKCNLYGIGNVVLSCTIPESDNSQEHPYTRIVSTLNMHNTENILENIHFVGNNTRYCIHDDSGFDEQNKQLIVRRCKFTHNGTESETYMPSPRCYGAGYATGRKALFENCVFASAGNCNYQFYVHTQGADFNLSDIETVVRECAFITPGKTAIDYQVTYNGVPGGVITVSNCYFASNCVFLLRPGSSAVDNPSATVFGSGNSPVTLTNQINATSYFIQ